MRGPAGGLGRAAGLAQVQGQRREHERGQDAEPGQRGQPAVPVDAARPGREHPAGAALGPQPRPVQARADGGQDHREQGDGDDHRHQRHQHAAVTDAAQHGHGQHDHRHQPDGHGEPGEDHRAPGVVHGLDDRAGVVAARGPLLAPAADHQQRVVDGHAQPDQGDEELHDLADAGDLGEPADDQERGEHGHAADQQRQQGQEAGEHEGQDDQRPDRADHGLGHEPGALGRSGLAVRQQLGAGDAVAIPCRSARLSGVLLVGDFLHPLDDLPVLMLLDRDVRHRGRWRGAMPMLLAGRKPDHIAWPDLLDRGRPRAEPSQDRT